MADIGSDLSVPSLKDLPKARIAVVGDAMTDIWVHGRVERISPEAPIPVFVKESERELPGGAANVAANIEALGAAAYLVGKLGNEWPVKTRYVVNRQQMFRVDDEDCTPITPEREREILHLVTNFEPDVIVISDYAKGVCTPTLCQALIETRAPVVVDPKDKDWTKYQGCAVITPNEQEFQAWGGRNSLLKFPNLIVTQGHRGMWLSSYGGRDMTLPAMTHEVADVTGAGDTVVATLACCLAIDMDLEQAARTANAAAGVVVQKSGTAICSLEELLCALA